MNLGLDMSVTQVFRNCIKLVTYDFTLTETLHTRVQYSLELSFIPIKYMYLKIPVSVTVRPLYKKNTE